MGCIQLGIYAVFMDILSAHACTYHTLKTDELLKYKLAKTLTSHVYSMYENPLSTQTMHNHHNFMCIGKDVGCCLENDFFSTLL